MTIKGEWLVMSANEKERILKKTAQIDEDAAHSCVIEPFRVDVSSGSSASTPG